MKLFFLPFFWLTIILVVQACNSKKTKTDDNENTYSIPMEIMNTDISKMNKEISDTLEIQSTTKEVCITKNIKTTPGCSDCMLLDPRSDVFFLGNVLSAPSLQDGTYGQIGTAKDRKPMTISASIPSFFKTTAKVDSVSLSNVRTAVKSMIMSKLVGIPPAEMSINTTQIYDEKQLNLVLLGNFSTSMSKVSAGFNFEDNSVQSRFLIDIVQIYYSIDLDRPGPDGFFSKKPSNIGDISPVYVGSVKYGRRILVAVESKNRLKKSDVEVKAEYKGVVTKASAQGSFINDTFLSENSVKVMIRGGNPKNGYDLFTAVSKAEPFFDILKKDAICSKDNPGKELSFSFRNASTGDMFNISQAGEYVARKCEIKVENDTTIIIPPGIIQHQCAVQVGGGDRNFPNDPNAQFNLKLYFEGNTVYSDISVRFEENGGDNTAGSVTLYRYPICSLSIDKEITEIKIFTTSVIPNQALKNKGLNGFSFDESSSAVSSVSLIGDSDNNNNDDLFPGPCVDDKHAQIRQIDFFPIKLVFTKKVRNIKNIR